LIVVFCCSAQAAYLELLFTSWGAESAAAAPVDSKPPATGFLDAGRSASGHLNLADRAPMARVEADEYPSP